MGLSSIFRKLSPSGFGRDADAGKKDSDYVKAREAFERDGYVIFRGAIEPELIDSFWDEVDRLQREEPELTYGAKGEILKNRDVLEGKYPDDPNRLRITCIENFSRYAPAMMLHGEISGFLKAVYGRLPTCIQTLTYRYSSQQGLHSDKYLVSPRSVGQHYDRDTLAAAWVACETVNEDNGALIIYPGSHKLEKKRLLEDFDGRYNDYVDYLTELCAEAGIEPERFHAEKGDVLFWHGDFVHAGGNILDKERTRRSLVVHYADLDADDSGVARHKVTVPTGAYFVDDPERAPAPAG